MWWSRKKDSDKAISLGERIQKRGLERVAAQIIGSARECIRFKTVRANEEAIPLGASKLGGQADLPESTEWPGGDDLPMTFLAQINTNDLPDFEGKSDLPADTLLSFFYDIGTSPGDITPRIAADGKCSQRPAPLWSGAGLIMRHPIAHAFSSRGKI